MDLEDFLDLNLSDLDQDDELVDLRCLDYVTDYDDHLMCPICHCPFISPVRLHCDHIFCQKCLHTAITLTGNLSDFKCPSCRDPTTDVFLNVPRLLTNMCDDVKVKCPFSDEGCEEIMSRGHVQTHVDRHCDYKLVDCQDVLCEKKARKKDLNVEGRCLHDTYQCSDCGEYVMERDFRVHNTELCPGLRATCPDCKVTIFRRELDHHLNVCPEAVHPCSGSKYGCPVTTKRADLTAHSLTCPMNVMAPYLEKQKLRVDSLELAVRHLQQRNEVFEDGMANIRTTLSENSHDRNRGGRGSNQSSENQPSPESTTYLLSLHESLREEVAQKVAQTSRAITDLDARASMTILNECLRINEDMAHTKAALHSIRMQVQWLINPRLHHHSQHTPDLRVDAENSTHESRPARLDSSTSSPSSEAGPSLRPRRLSDNGREGTKL